MLTVIPPFKRAVGWRVKRNDARIRYENSAAGRPYAGRHRLATKGVWPQAIASRLKFIMDIDIIDYLTYCHGIVFYF